MCDVYSYAIVLWELVTFKVPFEGLPDMVILMDVTSGAVGYTATLLHTCIYAAIILPCTCAHSAQIFRKTVTNSSRT